MTPTFSFFVPGLPRPEPRARTFTRNGITRTARDPRCDGWKHAIRAAFVLAHPAQPGGAPLFGRDAAVAVDLLFVFERPAAHLRRDGTPKPAARAYPSVAPDADNLAKAVLDALGPWPAKRGAPLAWLDDCIVVDLRAQKVYGDTPGCLVALEPLSVK